MKNLVRTRGGLVIHRADCRHAAVPTAVPWNWAKERLTVELLAWSARLGLKPCGVCKPLDDPGP